MRKSGTSVALAGAIAMAALFQPQAAEAASIGFSLTIDESTNTLTSSLAGVSITTLNMNHWSIDLAGAGFAFLSGPGTNMTWAASPGEPGVNWLHKVSLTVLELNSDWTGATPGLFSACGSTAAPLPQGVTCAVGGGGGNGFFVTVVEQLPVPEPMSLALLGAALAGLGVLGSRRRA